MATPSNEVFSDSCVDSVEIDKLCDIQEATDEKQSQEVEHDLAEVKQHLEKTEHDLAEGNQHLEQSEQFSSEVNNLAETEGSGSNGDDEEDEESSPGSSWEDLKEAGPQSRDDLLQDTTSDEEEVHEDDDNLCPFRSALRQAIERLAAEQRKREQAETKLHLLAEVLEKDVQEEMQKLQRGIFKLAVILRQGPDEAVHQLHMKIKDMDEHSGLLEDRLASLRKRLEAAGAQLEEQKDTISALKTKNDEIKAHLERHLSTCACNVQEPNNEEQ